MELAVDVTITSGNDSVHMKDSFHYSDRALDFRTKNLTAIEKKSLIKITQRRLGPNYQLILEDADKPNEHLHIEYDPK